MQKAPVMKGSGLIPLEEAKPNEEVHVFGRNLEERVLTKDEAEASPSISFDNISNNQNSGEDDIESIRKRKFDAITGEEDEETIFQSDFKLFVWNLETLNWIERGRGQLRLNDSIGDDEKKSRLIMRVSGTLRIILNVAINRSYFKVIANSKTNIRFTDSQTVWAASGTNANKLKELIDERLKMTSEEEECELRKRSKPNEEDEAPSKRTRADQDERSEESLPTTTNENEADPDDAGEVARISSAQSEEEGDSKEEGENKVENKSDSETSKANNSDTKDESNEGNESVDGESDSDGGSTKVKDPVEKEDTKSNSDDQSSGDGESKDETDR